MSLKKTAISGVKWTSVEKIGTAVFQLLQVAILTRFLPKEAFGLIAMAVVVVNFSNIFVNMGLSTAILHKQDATKKEYSSIYWLNIFVSVILYLGLFISAPFVADFYSEIELLNIIPLLGLNVLIISIGRQHRTIMQKEFKFKKIAIVELLSIFCGLIVAVELAIRGYGVYSLVYSTLMKSVIANGLFLILNLRANPLSFYFTFKDTQPFIKVGGYQMGSSLVGFFSKEVDILIIGRLLNAEILGVYSLSKQIVLRLYSLVNPMVTNVLSPLLSSIQNEDEKLRNTYLRTVKYFAHLNFPIYLLIIVLSKEILFLVYGPSYAEGYIVLSFISIYYCLSAISNPVGSLQVATGRTDLGFLWTILRVIVTPILFYFSACFFGVNGVAVSHAILAITLILPMWFIQIKPMIEISFIDYIKQFYRPMLPFLFLSLLFILSEYIFDIKQGVDSMVLKFLLASLLYTGFVFIFDKKSISELYQFIIFSVSNRSVKKR